MLTKCSNNFDLSYKYFCYNENVIEVAKERSLIMRTNRISFEELVDQNKQKLLNDQQALDKIDEHLDEKRVNNSDQNKMIN